MSSTHSSRRRAAPGRAVAAILAGTLALGACSSAQAPRFHSLMPAPATGAATPAAKVAPAGVLAWEVLPVGVPPGVDQPQWVVRSIDGSLVVLEQERWVGPLADEIRAAVTAQLTQSLGAPAARTSNLWRVRIDVQRFESAPGREARIEVVWSVASDAGPSAAALRCRGEFTQVPDAGGYLALAAGHQKSVARMTESIASGLKAVAAGQAGSCQG